MTFESAEQLLKDLKDGKKRRIKGRYADTRGDAEIELDIWARENGIWWILIKRLDRGRTSRPLNDPEIPGWLTGFELVDRFED